jgi:hypothetical protein
MADPPIPSRPPGAIPLVLATPPKPVNEMTDAERSAWAHDIATAMSAQIKRLRDAQD